MSSRPQSRGEIAERRQSRPAAHNHSNRYASVNSKLREALSPSPDRSRSRSRSTSSSRGPQQTSSGRRRSRSPRGHKRRYDDYQSSNSRHTNSRPYDRDRTRERDFEYSSRYRAGRYDERDDRNSYHRKNHRARSRSPYGRERATGPSSRRDQHRMGPYESNRDRDRARELYQQREQEPKSDRDRHHRPEAERPSPVLDDPPKPAVDTSTTTDVNRRPKPNSFLASLLAKKAAASDEAPTLATSKSKAADEVDNDELDDDDLQTEKKEKEVDRVARRAAWAAKMAQDVAPPLEPEIQLKSVVEEKKQYGSEIEMKRSPETGGSAANMLGIRLEERQQQPEEAKTHHVYTVDSDASDMFADDFDDRQAAKEAEEANLTATKLNENLLDNWDDPQGYYKVILRELLDGRYEVSENLGKGTFANVIRATDKETNQFVAIKIVRTHDKFIKTALHEIEILTALQEGVAVDRKHIVGFQRKFYHKKHLCLVLESLKEDLREVLKRYGRDIGIQLDAVRLYASQMFVALAHLRDSGIVHADIKPDNMLVDDKHSVIKICDFGSAIAVADIQEAAPQQVSRFYRAPEIMLGLRYGPPVDMWAVGCSLYELYTGAILFTGENNNQMLKQIMDCRGRIPMRVCKKGEFALEHFDDDFKYFKSQEKDPYTRAPVVKLLNFNNQQTEGIKKKLLNTPGTVDSSETNDFVDLLEHCLALNPDRRITPLEALNHPFIARSRMAQQASKHGGVAAISGNPYNQANLQPTAQ